MNDEGCNHRDSNHGLSPRRDPISTAGREQLLTHSLWGARAFGKGYFIQPPGDQSSSLGGKSAATYK